MAFEDQAAVKPPTCRLYVDVPAYDDFDIEYLIIAIPVSQAFLRDTPNVKEGLAALAANEARRAVERELENQRA